MKFIHCALLAAMAMQLSADSITLPGASYDGQIAVTVIGGTGQQETIQSLGGYSVSASPSNIGTAAAGVSTEPFPSVSMTESVTEPTPQQLGNYVQSAVSADSIRYDIEFSGPTATVPIEVNAFLSASITGNSGAGYSQALFRIADVSSNQGAYVLDDELYVGQIEYSILRGVNTPVLTPQNSLSLTDSGIWMANTNTVYSILLNGDAETYTGTDPSQLNGGTGSAFIDPTFQIASTVADPQDYSISLSPGIGNTPASVMAPEPSSAVLALAGAGAICWMFRRRRKMKSHHGQAC